MKVDKSYREALHKSVDKWADRLEALQTDDELGHVTWNAAVMAMCHMISTDWSTAERYLLHPNKYRQQVREIEKKLFYKVKTMD